jgi:hypothetical protein
VGQLFVRHSCALWTLWSLISNIPLPFCHRCVGSFQFQALWSLILPSFQLQSKMPVYVQVSSKSGTAFQIVYDSLLNLQSPVSTCQRLHTLPSLGQTDPSAEGSVRSYSPCGRRKSKPHRALSCSKASSLPCFLTWYLQTLL